MKLRQGQIWEFVNSEVNSDGSVREYELMYFDREGRYGRADLRNLENDKMAYVTAYSLLQGSRAPYAYWRPAA